MTGDAAAPTVAADTVVVREGVVAFVGSESGADASDISVVIDAAGATVAPGLCDDHTHPVMGDDFTPRQSQLGFIDSDLDGGTTTMISAGEPDSTRVPDRPARPTGPEEATTITKKKKRLLFLILMMLQLIFC